MNHKRKNFRVPHHDIKIWLSELLFINTKTFQRLNNIKQLGLAYLVYPFALHTRASHCLDCLEMAQQFFDSLKTNIERSTILADEQKKEIMERLNEDIESIRAVALLHDIMHIPFAHTLEDENNIFPRGDKSKRINIMLNKIKEELDEMELSPSGPESLKKSIESIANYRIFSFSNPDEFRRAVKNAKQVLDDVRKALWTIALHDEVEMRIKAEKEARTPSDKIFHKVKRGIEEERKDEKVSLLEAERYYISDLIGNAISSDLLSYILRDPEFTGIETKPGGWYRLLDYLEIVKDLVGRNRLVIRLTKNGEWRQDAFSTIIRILNVRYDLTEQVIYHHAKLSAGAMLGKIAQLCCLPESNDLYEVGDEGLFKLLENRISDMKNGKVKIEDRTKEDAKGAEKLLESLKCRRLHKRFHVISSARVNFKGFDLSEKYSKPDERLRLERKIQRLGLKPGSIIVFCPRRGGALKEAETLVTYEKIKPDRTLEPVTLPLKSNECRDFLKTEKGESTSMKVKNVADQYEDLWKLYVFVDPTIIPIYGAEVKRLLNDELGPSLSFDLSYLELMEEFELSKEIARKVTEMRIPEVDREEVFEKIPLAITQIGGRDRILSLNWIRNHLEDIIHTAREMAGSEEISRKLL